MEVVVLVAAVVVVVNFFVVAVAIEGAKRLVHLCVWTILLANLTSSLGMGGGGRWIHCHDDYLVLFVSARTDQTLPPIKISQVSNLHNSQTYR